MELVDEVIALDSPYFFTSTFSESSLPIGTDGSMIFGIVIISQGKKEEAESKKAEVSANAARLAQLEEKENELREKIRFGIFS